MCVFSTTSHYTSYSKLGFTVHKRLYHGLEDVFFNYYNPGVEGVLQYPTEPQVPSLDLNIAQVEVK